MTLRASPHLFLLMASLVAGCASVPSQVAKVQIHRQTSTLLDECKKVGPVMTDTRGGPFNFMDVAETAAREETLRLGGDSVALLNVERHVLGRIVLQGVAYKCF